ncbi:MAG: SPASM domain-containing protein [Clostridia bacterium]|nr:SPASM domain-containing protein [Clostridia bacterium]
MKSLNIMIKPASSLCNMRCKYCFYADVSHMRDVASFGIMNDETMHAVLGNIRACLNEGDRVNFAFQGGEPTLAGLDFFVRFADAVSDWQGISVSYALQTNAYILDDEWCKFLKKHNFLVGVSFDILPDAHDCVRVDEKGKGTFSRILESIRKLKEHKVDFNVLCTLTNSIARHPEKVWKQVLRLDIDYVQFTPCLGELDGDDSVYALTPRRFASFYTQLFTLWYNEYRAGKYRSVKFFDDVVNLIILGTPTSCGMDGKCRPQLVVEADGSAYPCDFYCLDEYKLGNLKNQTVDALLASENVGKFLGCKTEIHKICETCNYRQFCGGNCRRMRNEICIGKDKNFCGYREFLDNCGETLAMLARELVKKR